MLWFSCEQVWQSDKHIKAHIVKTYNTQSSLWTVLVFSFIMAGCLLFVILVYSFLEIQAQALLPPKLTVNPPMITETDSVTLNCQTPSSVSVSQCYFYTLSGGTVRVFSCLQTLTGIELLKMAYKSSPVEVEVKCYYTVKVGELKSHSPNSDTSSITIHHIVESKSSIIPTMPTFSMTKGRTLYALRLQS
ncbi:uncharacterized protein LOC117943416 [Etheostoma cragini]|uniref:uncharacterized protein LOC117943416 n=1 Tax=Etheostoma cragini TaxID=417921 RepID=UPI00155E45F5|nr:uncharacterized protein LOC117943416 [Etheostoma cragini]